MPVKIGISIKFRYLCYVAERYAVFCFLAQLVDCLTLNIYRP